MRIGVRATHLVDLDPADIEKCLERITAKAHRRCHVGFELNRYALDLETILEREVDELHIECKPVDPLKTEQCIGNVAPEALQPALRVEGAAGDDGRRNA